MADPATEKYIDSLILALRMRNVPGNQIGQVVAEVESHIAESGEDPTEAFGTPREYAAHWTRRAQPATDWLRRLKTALAIVAAGVGGYLLAQGAVRVATGEQVWGMSQLVVILVGLALLVLGMLGAGKDLIVDPFTGEEPQRLKRTKRRGLVLLVAVPLAILAVAIVASRF